MDPTRYEEAGFPQLPRVRWFINRVKLTFRIPNDGVNTVYLVIISCGSDRFVVPWLEFCVFKRGVTAYVTIIPDGILLTRRRIRRDDRRLFRDSQRPGPLLLNVLGGRLSNGRHWRRMLGGPRGSPGIGIRVLRPRPIGGIGPTS